MCKIYIHMHSHIGVYIDYMGFLPRGIEASHKDPECDRGFANAGVDLVQAPSLKGIASA